MTDKIKGFAILAHAKPMQRHTKHVVPVTCVTSICLPGIGGPTPGLHLELQFDTGANQRVIFPFGAPLSKLAQASRMAEALQEAPEDLGMAALRFTNLVELYMCPQRGHVDPPDEEEVSTAMCALRALINSQP